AVILPHTADMQSFRSILYRHPRFMRRPTVAGEHSDLVFVTSDNPRTEDPAAIAAQIEEGVHESGLKKLEGASDEDLAGPGYILELDRGKAIQSAIGLAHESDLILIAGKGHEDYQIIGKGKRHFDDREVAAQAVRNLTNNLQLDC
ncbi:MAG: hypothetical protein L6406_13780, partial [Desulfobacterales bacterium]|nr:hypothetical protein [Desulfobacterales bacterium]